MLGKSKRILTATVVFTFAVCFVTGCIISVKSSNDDRSYDVRIMSANLLAHYESWGGIPVDGRDEMFFELLDEYQPDVAGLQEICEDWRASLDENLPVNYRFVQTDTNDDFVHMTAMIYNAEVVSLKDCGEIEFSKLDDKRTRRVVWAVFETQDNLLFAVTSTHFSFLKSDNYEKWADITDAQAVEMCRLSEDIKNKYNCPVFLTGDFNTSESDGVNEERSVIYNKLCTYVTDAKYIALSVYDGDGYSAEKPCIDHIFIKGNATVQSFGIISDTKLKKMSDHYPIVADIEFKQ